MRAQGHGVREIARRLERAPSTISRELRRNAATRSGGLDVPGDDGAMARRPIRPSAEAGEAGDQRGVAGLRTGSAGGSGRRPERGDESPDGRGVEGPPARASAGPALGHGVEPGADRPPAAARLPGDETMRISHEAIYQALYVQGRGALRRELTACLRTGRALRVPRARTRGRGKAFMPPEIMISQRPAEAADRAVPGHWEGDLDPGAGQFGHRHPGGAHDAVHHAAPFAAPGWLRMRAAPKNGPALAGHGAEAVRDAITRTITTLPERLRQSLTWDQGAEMAQHGRLQIDAGLRIYFCDPHSPRQRGTNEKLLRQYFPKGTDLSVHSVDDLTAVAMTLNVRPRKNLGLMKLSSDIRNWTPNRADNPATDPGTTVLSS